MILLVGYGYWGKNLARNFSDKLTAICDSNPDSLKEAKNKYPNVDMYHDLDSALKDSRIAAVIIATKANTHFEVAVKCLKEKKHIWIEKPVCEKLNEIDRLIDLSENVNRIIFVDHTFCYNPAIMYLKNSKVVEFPLYYNSNRMSHGQFQNDVDVVLDLAIHDLSIINFLYPNLKLDKREIIKNYHVNNIANQASINLKFNNGFNALINCNWVSPIKIREVIIVGKNKSIVYDDMSSDKIREYSHKDVDSNFSPAHMKDIYIPRIPNDESLYNARKHFLKCIKENLKPKTNIYESKKIMSWIL